MVCVTNVFFVTNCTPYSFSLVGDERGCLKQVAFKWRWTLFIPFLNALEFMCSFCFVLFPLPFFYRLRTSTGDVNNQVGKP